MVAVVCTCPPVPREPSQLSRERAAGPTRRTIELRDGRDDDDPLACIALRDRSSKAPGHHLRLRAGPRRPRALAVVAAAGKKGEAKTGLNLIKPKPMYAKGEEPWWIDPETGKAPGYLQITVFMASQLFVGMVMQPFALWYGQLFEPYVQNCTGIGC